MRKIFVSHPYSSNPEKNKAEVDKICKDLVEQGYLPLSPLHLFSFMEQDSCREQIMEICFKLIDLCDEVWIFGESRGCAKERNYAVRQGKPIREVKVVVNYAKT